MEVTLRGNLENMIDNVIQKMPEMVGNVRSGTKQELLVKDEADFILGYCIGYIFAGFQGAHIVAYNRPLDVTLRNEALDIIYKRAGEIREAIFKQG